MSEWEPISTAPKDWTRLDLSPAYDRDSAVGYWTELYGGCWYMDGVGHLNGQWKPERWRHTKQPMCPHCGAVIEPNVQCCPAVSALTQA